MKKRFINLALLVSCVLFCASTIEVGARFIEPDISFRNTLWIKRDAYLGWVNKPGVYGGFQIDANGNRFTESDVLCIGDSGTFGYHKDSNGRHCFDTWTGAWTNTGVMGYTSWNILRVLRDDAGRHKTVVARVGWNDHCTQHTASLIDSPIAGYLRHSAAGRITLLYLTAPPVENAPFVTKEKFRGNIAEIIRLCQVNGQRLIFVDYPIDYTKDVEGMLWSHRNQRPAMSIADVRAAHEAYQDIIRDECKKNGVDYLATNPTFSNLDGVHPDHKGMIAVHAAVRNAIQDTGQRLANNQSR